MSELAYSRWSLGSHGAVLAQVSHLSWADGHELELRKVADGIFYVLRTGCQWKAAPREFGSGSSLHRYFQEWARRHVFHKLWKYLLRRYDALRGIQWKWQSLDGSTTKAPLGGEKNRAKPDGSGQVGRQAVGADRRSRRAVGLGG